MEVGRGKTRKEAKERELLLLLGCARALPSLGGRLALGSWMGEPGSRDWTGQLELEPEALFAFRVFDMVPSMAHGLENWLQ